MGEQIPTESTLSTGINLLLQIALSHLSILSGYLGIVIVLAGLGYGQGYWHVFGIDTAAFDSGVALNANYIIYGLWTIYDFIDWAFLCVVLMLCVFIARYTILTNFTIYLDLVIVLVIIVSFFVAPEVGKWAGKARAEAEITNLEYQNFAQIFIFPKAISGEKPKAISGETQNKPILDLLSASECLRKLTIDRKNLYVIRAVTSVNAGKARPDVFIVPITELSSIEISPNEPKFCKQ